MHRLLIYLALALAACVGGYVIHLGQQTLRTKAPLLPLTFAHLDHRQVNCVDCHHNFIDHTGQGLCLDCHKTDPLIAADIETQFHTLCRDCHLTHQAAREESGPTRVCADCHTADDAP